MKQRSFSENYNALVSSQKQGKGTPFYTRFVNRKLGQIFAAFFCQWDVSPNTITVVSGLFTFIGYMGFLFNLNITFFQALFLVLLLVVGYGLDSADGLTSRLLSKQSAVGEWLDHSFDAIKIPLGHGVAAMLILNSGYNFFYMKAFLLILIASSSALFLSNLLKSNLIVLNKLKNGEYVEKKAKQGDGGKHILRSLLTLPIDYGTFMALFLLVPYSNVFAIAFSAYGAFYILFTIVSLFLSFKELKTI